FSNKTNHLVLNRSAEEADLIRVRIHQAMLNLVSQEIFPCLPDTIDSAQPSETNSTGERKTFLACSGMHYVYRGKDLGFQFSPDEFDYAETQKACMDIHGLREELEALKQSQPFPAAPDCDKQKQLEVPDSVQDEHKMEPEDSHPTYPNVVFLGTGSSEPNKIRNQSCIVVQLSKDAVIILDCGEDSYGQLHRFYGKQKTLEMLRKVKAIFVSHMHGDHHLGLFSLLKERAKAFAVVDAPFTPVLLMAPIQMRRWLKFYHQELESVTHLLRFVKHQKNMKEFDDKFNLSLATFEDVKQDLQLNEYRPVEVVHCRNAFGLVFTHENGYKVVYSGDTRPCESLVEAGADCDLLIHEATHEDALIAHAKASKHSTFSEAMDVGTRMKAKHVILTHFSQRYPHMVPFFDMDLPHNVGIAFDNMQVCPKTLASLPRLISPLTVLFTDKLQHLEIKRIKRTREQAENEEYEAKSQENR
ncbi:Zinc phosphodiesterase elac protein 2, partial [Plakobranchus ocellatus]